LMRASTTVSVHFSAATNIAKPRVIDRGGGRIRTKALVIPAYWPSQ
jgi:hypothetical protein